MSSRLHWITLGAASAFWAATLAMAATPALPSNPLAQSTLPVLPGVCYTKVIYGLGSLATTGFTKTYPRKCRTGERDGTVTVVYAR